jgi:hypothetical protein
VYFPVESPDFEKKQYTIVIHNDKIKVSLLSLTVVYIVSIHVDIYIYIYIYISRKGITKNKNLIPDILNNTVTLVNNKVDTKHL